MNKGFTLLEILFVLTIISALIGGATITYTRFNAQKGLTKDVIAFKDVINTAREKAIARDVGTTTNCTTFTGYRVQVNPATSSYSLFRLCAGMTIPALSTYQLQMSRFAGSSAYNIDFLYPYGTVAASQTVRFNNTRVTGCQEVLINAAGVITDQSC